MVFDIKKKLAAKWLDREYVRGYRRRKPGLKNKIKASLTLGIKGTTRVDSYVRRRRKKRR